ncbi:AbrB/MazE/SpoVT family DNA-binding domain-containing protein [Caulobacter sp. BK020]|uniref:AbrB/MazE/SpoVT family DNA-binding domain-containing protein n=1 Tax=Caulobacter sp. BK020 TaxID=2512117 RepID=UPI00104EB714|nr:AbrB/MazE/SpoVT family DNA-binding domain-containing protein [Caulobacter sp. BK020]TCS12848.1 antitoxin component of MazEF toxin-antitoxin module [Caulobacter sp. BK020]
MIMIGAAKPQAKTKAEATVGTWGKSLAVRIPLDVVRSAGLSDGEKVEIEVRNGDIVIHRADVRAEARARALAAFDEIIADSEGRTLGGISIRELIDEGRG